jgi:hypothetical protein
VYCTGTATAKQQPSAQAVHSKVMSKARIQSGVTSIAMPMGSVGTHRTHRVGPGPRFSSRLTSRRKVRRHRRGPRDGTGRTHSYSDHTRNYRMRIRCTLRRRHPHLEGRCRCWFAHSPHNAATAVVWMTVSRTLQQLRACEPLHDQAAPVPMLARLVGGAAGRTESAPTSPTWGLELMLAGVAVALVELQLEAERVRQTEGRRRR